MARAADHTGHHTDRACALIKSGAAAPVTVSSDACDPKRKRAGGVQKKRGGMVSATDYAQHSL